jgi:cytochrome c553
VTLADLTGALRPGAPGPQRCGLRRPHRWRERLAILLLTVGGLSPLAGLCADALDPQADVQAGKALYWDGRTASGTPVSAMTAEDVPASGKNFACVNCHRPSGLGASEGNKYVLPITGAMLFAPRELNRNRVFGKLFHETRSTEFMARMKQGHMRPAYTDATLAQALRTGVDPAGRALDRIMPRYALSDRDLANLVAYLRTLSARPDPGVDDTTLHIATVVTDTADPGQRDAMLQVMRAYIDRWNLALRNDRSRGQFSPYYHSDFVGEYRRWQLHVWELHGAPDTWAAQIARAYQTQPVFFVAGGLVNGPWQPMADFCDRERVPCLFPNTELPRTTNATDGYSFYFSRGLALEAEVLATHLARTLTAGQSVAQIHVNDPAGATPAAAFAAALKSRAPNARLTTVEVQDPQALAATVQRLVAAHPDLGTLAIWPGREARAAVEQLRKLGPVPVTIALPSGALPLWQEPSAAARNPAPPGQVIFTYPYEPQPGHHPRSYVVNAWMRSQGIALTHPRLQMQTYYTMTLAEDGLRSLVGDYYRDYFDEFVESEAESNLNPGTHPSLALGPGQRFASKGAFIAVPDATLGVKALTDWIIP